MSVTITVSQVREALYRVGAGPGPGQPSTARVGQIFHDVVADLLNKNGQRLAKYLEHADRDQADVRAKLVNRVFHDLLAPSLNRSAAQLTDQGPELLNLWQAIQHFLDWLAQLVVQQCESAHQSPDRWLRDSGLAIECEGELAWEIEQPNWNQPVTVQGRPDAVFRLPNGPWCVAEWKLGATQPEADLSQACLYHQMLAATNGHGTDSPLSLVSFYPQVHERNYPASDLATVQDKLIDLIGKIAGVVGSNSKRTPTPPPPPPPIVRPDRSLAERLVDAIREAGVEIGQGGPPTVAPSFIRVPLRMKHGATVKKVQGVMEQVQYKLNLEQEPQVLKLGARVVIDLERPDREVLDYAAIRDQFPEPDPLLGSCHLMLGLDCDRTLHTLDLTLPDNPHVLVAGTPGSGKSEWLRVALAGLIETNTPDTLRLVLIDPKRNAFHDMANSPFLYDRQSLVFPDERPASEVLNKLVEAMELRYQLFEGDDSLASYIRRTGRVLPRIVLICDEYFDLLAGSGERQLVEQAIFRLGAKARAAGIHLVLATQRADRKTVSGTIDANIIGRIGFKMGKALESRILLEQSGCEKLLGRGDLLYKKGVSLVRVQAPLLSEQDRKRIFTSGSPSPSPTSTRTPQASRT